jgi:hypothetical protein
LAGTGETAVPIETIELEGGTVVAFFEPAPGELQTMQWGPNGSLPAISTELAAKKLNAPKLFEALSGRAASHELVAAQARADELAAAGRPKGAEAESEEVARLPIPTSALTPSAAGDVGRTSEAALNFDCKGEFSYDEWFACSFCATWPTWAVNWMWVSGSGSFTRNDNTDTVSTVSVFAGGSVHFKNENRTWYSWSTPLDTFVSNGFWAQRSEPLSLVDFDIRSTVDNAAGDSYHWCGWGNK